MALPYENARAGGSALVEAERILQRFGCSSFGTMRDWKKGTLLLQFEWRGRQISLQVSYKGYAAAWLKEHPYSGRMRKTRAEHEAEALKRGEAAAPSILRDWIKAQVTAIEVGLMPFEHVFMPFMLAHDGQRLVDHAVKYLEAPRDAE